MVAEICMAFAKAITAKSIKKCNRQFASHLESCFLKRHFTDHVEKSCQNYSKSAPPPWAPKSNALTKA
jgi:hypothetical protein